MSSVPVEQFSLLQKALRISRIRVPAFSTCRGKEITGSLVNTTLYETLPTSYGRSFRLAGVTPQVSHLGVTPDCRAINEHKPKANSEETLILPFLGVFYSTLEGHSKSIYIHHIPLFYFSSTETSLSKEKMVVRQDHVLVLHVSDNRTWLLSLVSSCHREASQSP